MSVTDTSVRLIETAKAVPIGRWCSTEQVHAVLEGLWYRVSRRTVQRDLMKLCRPFGIDIRGGKSIGCEWRRTRPLE